MIYEFRNKKLHIALNSQDDCGHGLNVGFYRNDECVEYNPNRLTFEQINENEISFNGTLFYYCKLGFDRNQTDTIINKKVINVTYNFNPDLSKWILRKETYPCW
ncbi:hypothetical protein D3C78_1509360 [compost metagenome]